MPSDLMTELMVLRASKNVHTAEAHAQPFDELFVRSVPILQRTISESQLYPPLHLLETPNQGLVSVDI
jgi:hypothetical protein